MSLTEAHPGDSKRTLVIWFTEDLTFVAAILLVYWVSKGEVSFVVCASCTICGAVTTPLLLVLLLMVLHVEDEQEKKDFLVLIFNFAAQVAVLYGIVKTVLKCKAKFHQCGGHGDPWSWYQEAGDSLRPVLPLSTMASDNINTDGVPLPTSMNSFHEQLSWKGSFATS